MVNKKFIKGLTSNKVIVIASIFIVIVLFVAKPFMVMKERRSLSGSVKKIEVFLREAKNLATSSDSSYGVRFEEKRIFLFKGKNYSANINSQIVNLNDNVIVSEVSFAGNTSSVIFNKFTGETNNPGRIKLVVVSDNSRFKIINIFSNGTFFSD